MRYSLTRIIIFFLFSCIALYSYSQCCPYEEKVGTLDQYLYEYDRIEMDIYTDMSVDDWLQYMGYDYYGNPIPPQKWSYNKFVRVRAWSDRSENSHNYIQLYWWICDGSNPDFTQTYANGIGPKAGTYTLTKPMVANYNDHISNNIYYFTHTDIPTTQPFLFAYRTHDFYLEHYGITWVCPFSSYASKSGGPIDTEYGGTSYITHFNSLSVTVDVGDDGNIYIQIGGQECGKEARVTIGRKNHMDVYNLNVATEGNGTVSVTPHPECVIHPAGENLTLTPSPANSSVCFQEWKGADAQYITTTDNGDGTFTYTLTMQDRDMNVTAVFGDCAKEVTDYIDTCSAALPFTWRPWNNGGIEITDISQSGIQDKVKKGGINKEDSIITLNLTLHEPQKVPVEVKDTFWQCDFDLGDGNWINIVVDDGSAEGIILDMENAVGITYETTEPDRYGCDSITIHEVIIIPENVQRLWEFCQSDLSLGDNNYVNLELDDRLSLDGSFWGTFSGDSIIRDTTYSDYCGMDSITTDTIRIYPSKREKWNPGICADKMEAALAEGIPFFDLGPITDWSQDGLEYYTEGTVHGCDSVIVLDLTPIPNDTTYETMAVCSYPVTWRGKTYNSKEETETMPVIRPGVNKGDCQQYFFMIPEEAPAQEVSVDSTICQSELPFYWEEADLTFDEGGTKEHTFKTAGGGCDSIVTLKLTVIPTPDINEIRTICPAQLPYQWDEMTFNEEGTQTQTVHTEEGCNYIVSHTVLVIPDVIKDGDRVCSSQLPYTWEDEMIAADDSRFETNPLTGVKTLTIGPKVLPSSLECDSTVEFTLTVIPEQIYDHITICETEMPYTWHVGEQEIVINSEADAVNQSVELTSVLGCDSTVHLDLTIIPTAHEDLGTIHIKEGQTYTVFEGTPYEKTYSTDTPQEDVIGEGLSYQGCDSVVTLTVEIRNAETEDIYVTICEGGDQYPYPWNGMECNETKVYEYQTKTVHTDFDSIAYLHLTILPYYPNVTAGETICENKLPYTWEGETFTLNDDYTEIDEQTYFRQVTKDIGTKAGCDSIVTFTLTVHRSYVKHEEATVCRSQLPYIWEGETFTDGGTVTKELQTASGCDSVVTFTLTIAESYDIQHEEKICPSNLPYIWEGETFNEAGTITKTLRSSADCDSTVTFTLTVLAGSDNTVTDLTVCENELPYRWGNETFYEAGTKTQMFRSSMGCDSIVTLTLYVNPAYNITDGATVCQDALPYRWQDVTFTQSGTETRTLKTVLDCDSVVTFTLTVQTPTNDIQTETACDNQLPFQWNPTAGYTQDLYEGGTYNHTLKSSLGCDSIYYTLNLTIDRNYVAAQPTLTPLETCANDEALQIVLNCTTGTPAAYDITFDDRAAAQGLVSVNYQTIPADNIIAIPLPKNEDSTLYVRPDDYSLTLTVYDQCDRRTDYPLLFRILYPSWLIQQRWRDVLALYNEKYNGGYTFSVIRWYKNGTEISGQGVHNSYIQMSPVLEMATYYALLTRADDGKSLRTCDFVPNLASPYYAPEGEKIRLVQQTDSRHITVKTNLSGTYRIYDVTGKQIMNGYFGEEYGSPAIVFSPTCADGAYIILFQANNGTEDTKKWLIR